MESLQALQLTPSGLMLHKPALPCTAKSTVYGGKAQGKHAHAPDQYPFQDHHAQLCGL